MTIKKAIANISRQFFCDNQVYRYRGKRITDMDDDEVVQKCHWFCENHNLSDEWQIYVNKALSEYYFCPYLEEYISYDVCYDLQMIVGGYIKSSALPEKKIDKEKCAEHCFTCKYSL